MVDCFFIWPFNNKIKSLSYKIVITVVCVPSGESLEVELLGPRVNGPM